MENLLVYVGAVAGPKINIFEKEKKSLSSIRKNIIHVNFTQLRGPLNCTFFKFYSLLCSGIGVKLWQTSQKY